MATYFVSSVTGLSTNGGTTWALAYDKLATAIAGAGGSAALAAGDTVFVDDRHAETTAAATTLAFPNTAGTPCFILCADHTVGSPGSGNLLTTATVTTTGASTLIISGTNYFYGITWTAGDVANAANLQLTSSGANQSPVFEACQFVLGSTNAANRIQPPASSSANACTWINCKVQFNSASQSIFPQVLFTWLNSPSAIQGATLPTTLFASTTNGNILCDGVDFSALSGKTIFPVSPSAPPNRFILKDCLLPASVTIQAPSGTNTPNAIVVEVIRTDASGAGNTYRVEHYDRWSLTTETTIVRSGGASDGTIAFSRKIVTGAAGGRVFWAQPFNATPIAIWNDSVGSHTITVHATSNLAAGAFPNNDDIWIEVAYLGSATTPQASFANNSKANVLAANSAYTSDGSSWAGSPAGGTFAMTVGPITINQKGYIYVTVKVAKVSTTFYIDPLITVT